MEAIQIPQETSLNQADIMIPQPVSPLDMPVQDFSSALNRRESNRQALLKWIKDGLVEKIDFGRIHIAGKNRCDLARQYRSEECKNPNHWSKPSLWKPGAEKICGMLGLIPRFPNGKEYEKAAYEGREIKKVVLKCLLETPSGFVTAEGIGARDIKQDGGDINKALKMAEKSSFIDATLRVAGLSEIFTQDIEDMNLSNRDDQKNTSNPSKGKDNRFSAPENTFIQGWQKKQIYELIKNEIFSPEERRQTFEWMKNPNLSLESGNKTIARLESLISERSDLKTKQNDLNKMFDYYQMGQSDREMFCHFVTNETRLQGAALLDEMIRNFQVYLEKLKQ